MSERRFMFVGGDAGAYEVTAERVICGEGLPSISRLDVLPAAAGAVPAPNARWILRGIVSNERYVTAAERTLLVERQVPIGRAEARLGALIPIKKSAAWWALPQDTRRAIFEERSNHIAIGLEYLPAVARRLHHCRDLDPEEPFDFLTWFDFAEEDAPRFDELLVALRNTAEWQYVEREVEIRVRRVFED